jgi:glycosyltransferase involved in cell wall biosynthesis
VAIRMAAAQAGLDHDVSLIAPRHPSRASTVLESIAEVPGADRVRVYQTDLPQHSPFSTTHISGALDSILPVDVVHIHGTWGYAFLKIAKTLRKINVPYVLRPFGTLDYWSMSQKALKKKLALALAFRRMINGAGAIQALNIHEHDSILRFGFTTPVRIIPNGVFLDEVDIETSPDEFRQSAEGLGDHPYLLFLSRLHYKKGLDILAEAWKIVSPHHPDLKLVVAGPREDDSIDDFTKRIEDAGLGDTVAIPGPVYGSRKTAAFRESIGFVLPSRQEGFSVAITEALALGIPAVITNECHFPEVGQENAGIVTELDHHSFAQGVLKLLTDPEQRTRMGNNAATLIRDRYTWPSIAAQSEQLYLELCGQNDQ